MATISTTAKYSFRYNSVMTGGDSAARTISGLNFRTDSSGSDTGPDRGTAITLLYNTLSSLTTGTIGNARLVTEQEVIL